MPSRPLPIPKVGIEGGKESDELKERYQKRTQIMMETQKRLHIPLVGFQVTPLSSAAPQKESSDSSGLQSHLKTQKGRKPPGTIYRATSAKLSKFARGTILVKIYYSP